MSDKRIYGKDACTHLFLVGVALVLVAGCASLPARAGCAAGQVEITWTTKTPHGTGAFSNCWGDDCPPYAALVEYVPDRGVVAARCVPILEAPSTAHNLMEADERPDPVPETPTDHQDG